MTQDAAAHLVDLTDPGTLDDRALQLRREGHPYEEIAQLLDMAGGHDAYQAVARATRRALGHVPVEPAR